MFEFVWEVDETLLDCITPKLILQPFVENVVNHAVKSTAEPVIVFLQIAQSAAELGVELFVLDDGWFGKRNGDTSSLGDWYVNEDKIKCGLPELCRKVNALGMDFGIWIEPEMISMDSDLYRAHPDWMLAAPGRPPIRSRCQYVLDLSRGEIVDALFDTKI